MSEEISRLILESGDEEELTDNRETDCHTALTRGLCEYLQQIPSLPKVGDKSQKTMFETVDEDWVDPEKDIKFPSAAVYTQEPGFYDDTDFTSHREYINEPGSKVETDKGQVLKICSEFTQVIMVDVFCTNNAQRREVCRALEDYFEPVDWMSGFHLELPHYFNTRARFIKLSLDYVDSEENASKRWRMAQFQFEATVQQIKLLGKLPLFKPKLKLSVNVDV